MYADEHDDQDLRAAIAASLEQPQPEAASPAASAAQQDLWASGNPEVLTGFSTQFRCYAAAAVGRKDIDATGKILLPQSALHVLLAKLPEMPSTLLLRLSHEGSSAYCGIAEFLEDAEMSALLTRVAGQAVRSDELPRLFRGGPLAVCFVPHDSPLGHDIEQKLASCVYAGTVPPCSWPAVTTSMKRAISPTHSCWKSAGECATADASKPVARPELPPLTAALS